MLSLFSGIAGSILGVLGLFILRLSSIKFTNKLLISIFGGQILYPAISFQVMFQSIIISVCIGITAWIYPVQLALKIQPIQAINTE